MAGFRLGIEEELGDAPFIYKEPSYLERVNNHIYFYGDVERSQMLALNKQLKDQSNILLNVARMEDRKDGPSNLHLHVCSNGGEVFAGFSAMDEIINCEVPVYTYVDGCCASAATFLTIVGKRRFIKKHSYMLIHELRSGYWGKYSGILDDMKNNKRLMDAIKDIYKEFTKIPQDELNKILEHDIWWDAETSLKYGLVDEII